METIPEHEATKPSLREHLVRRGLVLMIVALPPLVWAGLPASEASVNWAWLPPAVGTLCAVAAGWTRRWATRVPLIVAAIAGGIITVVLALPDEIGFAFFIPAFLSFVVVLIATLVALFVPFRQEIE